MIALRILMLLAAVSVCYLLILHLGPSPVAVSPQGPEAAALPAHSQYKQALDQAQAAARKMRAQRAEADEK